MVRNITITVETIEGESVKSVEVVIDGGKIKEYYSYPSTMTDATINTEVNADLDAKDYPV